MKKKNEAVETVLCERVLSAEEVACISVQIQQELEAYIDRERRYVLVSSRPEKGAVWRREFLWGVVVLNTRQVAKQHRHEPFGVMELALRVNGTECRLCALLMLVERFKRAMKGEKGDL